MDPTVVAATVVSWLAPYIAKAGEVVTRKVGDELYTAIKSRVADKPAAKEAIDDLEKAPGDADAQAALRLQIKKLLTEDKAFAAQLETMLNAAQAGGAQSTVNVTAKDRSVAAGRDVSGTILTGDVKGSIRIDNPDQKPGS
ncbi:MAG TPA: hypothetical protein VF932_03280 [Anaerolineae bacterium]